VRLADGSGRVVVDWCSNDYLGMSLHPAVVAAATEALAEHGVGSGGTRNIAGSHVLVRELEHELADLHSQEAALVFTSGFIANEASLRALGSLLEGCVILSDERNHASMIDGIRASRAQRLIFRHSDVEHLRELLAGLPPETPRIVAFESIYSMDADIAPLREICALAAEHGALTYLDETHAAGAYGHEGAGVAQALGATEDVTIVQGSLAKGYGALGGFIAGPASVVDTVRSHASGFIFTTSLPPAIAAAALASVRHLRGSSSERSALMRSVATLRDAFAHAGVEALASDSHIVPVLVPGAERCREVAQRLLAEHAIYVQPINYPSVARGRERLRIAPTPAHEPQHAEALARALADLLP
jgi:5-aminolevulinate synthase